MKTINVPTIELINEVIDSMGETYTSYAVIKKLRKKGYAKSLKMSSLLSKVNRVRSEKTQTPQGKGSTWVKMPMVVQRKDDVLVFDGEKVMPVAYDDEWMLKNGDLFEQRIKHAINLLKQNGYKVMKKIEKFEEV